MKFGLLFLLLLLLSGVSAASGQTAVSPPPEQNINGNKNQAGAEENNEESEYVSEVQPAAFKRNLSSWYGVWLTRKDKQAVAMSAQDAVRFADFLRQEDTGFVRLYDAATCETNLRVLNVADECPPNIPGRGIFYSFRRKKYQTAFFSDIKYSKNLLQAAGLNVLGFLVDLGDKPLNELSLQSGGIKEMNGFAPSEDLEKIRAEFLTVVRGFKIGEFFYRAALPLKENNTYALRAVAYQGKVLGRFGRFSVDVLREDKRQDVIILIRVIRKHSNGSVSLLWRELQRKPAPKLDFKKRKNQK